MSSLRWLGPMSALTLAVACASDVPAASTQATPARVATTPPTSFASTSAPAPTPEASLPMPAWQPFESDGCQCSDGSPVTFFERAGDPTRIVLYFEGGGACFSAATCDPEQPQPPYTVSQVVDTDELASRDGYFDATNMENPLRDHSWVYVPYCSGDVHLGDARTDYGGGVVIEHRGFTNASAALDHLVASFPDAEQVVVTGASAGSIPTPLFAGLVADRLPTADIVTFGDSSAAYPDVDPINETIGGLWGTTNAIPDWPETEGLTAAQWSIPELYVYAGRHAPRIRFGRFDYAFDEVQAEYGALAGVPAAELVSLIDRTEEQIEASGTPIAIYVAPGTDHTIGGTDELYTMAVDGVRLIDWLDDLVNGTEAPADVHCVTCN